MNTAAIESMTPDERAVFVRMLARTALHRALTDIESEETNRRAVGKTGGGMEGNDDGRERYESITDDRRR